MAHMCGRRAIFLKSLWEGNTGDGIPISEVRLTTHERHLSVVQQIREHTRIHQ